MDTLTKHQLEAISIHINSELQHHTNMYILDKISIDTFNAVTIVLSELNEKIQKCLNT